MEDLPQGQVVDSVYDLGMGEWAQEGGAVSS